jgi:hypothetical protein
MVIKRGLVIGTAAAEQERIVDEIEGPDTNLADHEDILWYPRFDSKVNIEADWSFISPNYPDTGTTGLTIVEWGDFGIPAARVKSQKAGDITAGGGSDHGESIMNWRKGVNSNNSSFAANAIGTTEETELYFRQCIMFEDMAGWGDPGNVGGKLSSISAWDVVHNISYRRPDHPTIPLGVDGYLWSPTQVPPWAGMDPFEEGYGLIPKPLMIPGITGSPAVANGSPAVGVIYSFEVHVKLNTRNEAESPTTFNADGRMRAWISSSDGEYDDVLMWDFQNLVLTTGPFEIDHIHGQLYAGGFSGPPDDYLYQQIGGFAVARRRIGPLKGM